jgi:hypothetical protein
MTNPNIDPARDGEEIDANELMAQAAREGFIAAKMAGIPMDTDHLPPMSGKGHQEIMAKLFEMANDESYLDEK